MRPSTASNRSFKSVSNNKVRELHKSYGKMNLSRLNNRDDEQTKAVIEAFGKYVSKYLAQGKGVAIPKLGQFTFTSVTVDLQGSTNPQMRDGQLRFPVFLIGRDFPCSVTIQQGIASGMTAEMFNPDG